MPKGSHRRRDRASPPPVAASNPHAPAPAEAVPSHGQAGAGAGADAATVTAEQVIEDIRGRQVYGDAYTRQYLAKNITTPFAPNLDILHDIRYTEPGTQTVKRLTATAIRVFGKLVSQYVMHRGRKAMVKAWDGRLYVRWSTEIWCGESRCGRTSLFRAWRRLEACGLVYRCPVRKPDPRRRDVTLTRLTAYAIDLCGLPTAAELRVAYIAGHPEIRRQWQDQSIRKTVERAFRDWDLWADRDTRWQPYPSREAMISGYVEQLDRPPEGPGWRQWGQGANAGANLARAIAQGLKEARRRSPRQKRRGQARHVSHAIASVLARTARLQR